MSLSLQQFVRYEAYQDSGVEWLGEIPQGWQVMRIKSLSPVKRGASPRPIDAPKYFSETGEYAWVRISDVTASNHYLNKTEQKLSKLGATHSIKLETSSLFLSIAGSVGKPIINNIKCCIHDGFVYFPHLKCDREFLYRVFESGALFVGLGKHGTQLNLNTETVGNIRVALPPLTEQTAIANFLDQKTAEIDQAIALKTDLIERLKEYKQITIQNAVTRGLDPNVKMKDSGVEWIGEIPEGWEISRSKYVFAQRIERSRKDDVQLSATQAYGVIPQDEYEQMIGRKVVKISLHLDKRKRVHIDDFVISMRSFQGGLERAWACGCIRSSYVVLKPVRQINTDFFAYLFKTPRYIKALQSTGSFIRDGQDLNFENFSKVDLFIPPYHEQEEIVALLNTKLPTINTAIDQAQQQIDKLSEYKTVLINAAVTGKIKVA